MALDLNTNMRTNRKGDLYTYIYIYTYRDTNTVHGLVPKIVWIPTVEHPKTCHILSPTNKMINHCGQ